MPERTGNDTRMLVFGIVPPLCTVHFFACRPAALSLSYWKGHRGSSLEAAQTHGDSTRRQTANIPPRSTRRGFSRPAMVPSSVYMRSGLLMACCGWVARWPLMFTSLFLRNGPPRVFGERKKVRALLRHPQHKFANDICTVHYGKLTAVGFEPTPLRTGA